MNRSERVRLGRIYGVLNTMSGLGPSNPADTKRVVAAYKAMDAAAPMLMAALDHLRHGEYAAADGYLDDAERVVGNV